MEQVLKMYIARGNRLDFEDYQYLFLWSAKQIYEWVTVILELLQLLGIGLAV